MDQWVGRHAIVGHIKYCNYGVNRIQRHLIDLDNSAKIVRLGGITMNEKIANIKIGDGIRNFGLLTTVVLKKLKCKILSEKYIKGV